VGFVGGGWFFWVVGGGGVGGLVGLVGGLVIGGAGRQKRNDMNKGERRIRFAKQEFQLGVIQEKGLRGQR